MAPPCPNGWRWGNLLRSILLKNITFLVNITQEEHVLSKFILFDIQQFEKKISEAYFTKKIYIYLSVLLSHRCKVLSLFLRMNISLIFLLRHM